ncbi:hypothetical protein [Micromonospora rhizosphaerae]|uniref:hypothetical protein n=1 Tax=Micromonospora rhizosphaerae TaxID=568872 RepID=UPI00159F0337|nr:hypothetical protein [Micromonospora rhizosphaerae]
MVSKLPPQRVGGVAVVPLVREQLAQLVQGHGLVRRYKELRAYPEALAMIRDDLQVAFALTGRFARSVAAAEPGIARLDDRFGVVGHVRLRCPPGVPRP